MTDITFQKAPDWLVYSFIITAFVGFIDSLHLTVSHLQGTPINCAFLDGCDLVTGSEYALWFGIPVAAIGLAYYLTVFFLSLTFQTNKHDNFLAIALGLTFFGFAASLWFVFLQVFIIKSLCFYCMVSALGSTLLFIFAIMIHRYSEEKK